MSLSSYFKGILQVQQKPPSAHTQCQSSRILPLNFSTALVPVTIRDVSVAWLQPHMVSTDSPLSSVFISLSWISLYMFFSLSFLILCNPHPWLCPEPLRNPRGEGCQFSHLGVCIVYMMCNPKSAIPFCFRHFLNRRWFYKFKTHGNKEDSLFNSSLSFMVDS